MSAPYDATLIISCRLSPCGPRADRAELVTVRRLTPALKVGGLEPRPRCQAREEWGWWGAQVWSWQSKSDLDSVSALHTPSACAVPLVRLCRPTPVTLWEL